MPPVSDLAELERRLAKRGFRRVDGFNHDCPACKEHAVITYGILAKQGGRTIKYCQACGKSQSWRSGAGMEQMDEDPDFDLETFLQ